MFQADRKAVLEVDGLVTEFVKGNSKLRALDRVSFGLHANETLGIVGESGCGKSLTSLSIMQLLPQPHGRITAGSIRLKGRELIGLAEREMQQIRGADIAMIFQEPLTALNPALTIGRQLAEPLRQHSGMDRAGRRRRVIEMLDLVRIPDAARRLNDYPHQLSGGMRQRVMIAMALICNPAVLIADEPTTALDVTTQAQILRLMRDLKDTTGASIMLITHDLGVIAGMAQRVIVMYAGRQVEQALVADLYSRPLHPYTQGLLRSIPRMGGSTGTDGKRERLAEIAGVVPPLGEERRGCTFADRCQIAKPRCRTATPELRDFGNGHLAACHEAGQ